MVFHCVCMFDMHLSVDGNLGCFHVLTIGSNAAMNRGCKCLFYLLFSCPSDIFPEVGLLDHMVALFLTFWGPSILFFVMLVPIYNPTGSVQEFLLLHILTSICYLLVVVFFFFMIDTLIGTRCYLIVVLIFMFLIVSDVEHLFSYQLDIQTSSLEKWLRSSDCFLIGLLGVFLFLLLSCMSSLYILGNNLLIDIKSSRFSR